MEIQFSQIVFFAKKLSHHFTIEAIIHLKIGHFNRLRSYISFNDEAMHRILMNYLRILVCQF